MSSTPKKKINHLCGLCALAVKCLTFDFDRCAPAFYGRDTGREGEASLEGGKEESTLKGRFSDRLNMVMTQ
jgi:hypothetical protein